MGLIEQGSHRHSHTPTTPIHHDPKYQMPCHKLPDQGISASVAYELISSSRCSTVRRGSTWRRSSPPGCLDRRQADGETANKNIIDKDEYPQTAEIEARCVNILADLGTRRSPRRRPDARRPAPARRRCSPGSRSSGAGASGCARRASRPTARTSSPVERTGLLGEVLPLLGRRAEARADGGRPVPPQRRGGRGPLRREHDRRGGGARIDVRRQLRAGQGDR